MADSKPYFSLVLLEADSPRIFSQGSFFCAVGDAIKPSSIGFIERFRLLLLLRRLLIVLLSGAFSSMRHSLSMGRPARKDDSKCNEGCSRCAATHYRAPA